MKLCLKEKNVTKAFADINVGKPSPKEMQDKELSIEEAFNYLPDLQKAQIKEIKESEKPITTVNKEDARAYLMYAFSLCSHRPSTILLFLLKIAGKSYQEVAQLMTVNTGRNITIQDVKREEIHAKNRVKEAIARTRATKIPVFEDPVEKAKLIDFSRNLIKEVNN